MVHTQTERDLREQPQMSARHPRRLLALLTAGLVATLSSSLLVMPAHAKEEAWVTQVGTYDYFVSPNYTGLALVASVITNQPWVLAPLTISMANWWWSAGSLREGVH